jgi:uncharacterized RDD family membrane protein YckC
MTDSGAGQPAGWYHAAGDPPGTHRYWDGTQWQGAPQPVGGATDGAVATAGGQPAENGKRFIAFLIDAGIIVGIYVVALILAGILGKIAGALGTLFGLLGFLAYLGFGIYNFIFLQGTTGQTIGKKHQGIKLVTDAGQPLGLANAFIRMLLSGLINMLCWADHIAILINDDGKRFSDKILGNQVVEA